MLCEKCHEREAHVKITKMINGITETHNLCQTCAESFTRIDDNSMVSEWSKAIFKMLSDAVSGISDEPDDVSNEQKSLTCPRCNKKYGDFLENGKLGCPDCYEAFLPYITAAATRIQGAEKHVGKSPLRTKEEEQMKVNVVHEKLSLAEEIQLKTDEMNAAVLMEDYKKAARLRDEILKLKGDEKNG